MLHARFETTRVSDSIAAGSKLSGIPASRYERDSRPEDQASAIDRGTKKFVGVRGDSRTREIFKAKAEARCLASPFRFVSLFATPLESSPPFGTFFARTSRGEAKGHKSVFLFQAPAQSMQPTARGNPRVPSPGPLRPFTPPDLSSIPHMDGTPTAHNDSNARNGASATGNAKISDESVPQEHTGPFIIGSPIDLGDIDNVDNIGIRLDPVVRNRRAREHIELQETGLSECDGESQ